MFEISNFTESDTTQWKVLWASYQRDENAPDEKIAKEVKANWPKIIKNDSCKSFALRHKETGKAVGFVTFVQYPSTTDARDECYLYDLCVLPEFQGKGGGKQLIDAVIKYANDHDLCEVSWLTRNINKQAQILYNKIATSSEWIRYKVDIS